jgi:hypothetical protein
VPVQQAVVFWLLTVALGPPIAGMVVFLLSTWPYVLQLEFIPIVIGIGPISYRPGLLPAAIAGLVSAAVIARHGTLTLVEALVSATVGALIVIHVPNLPGQDLLHFPDEITFAAAFAAMVVCWGTGRMSGLLPSRLQAILATHKRAGSRLKFGRA